MHTIKKHLALLVALVWLLVLAGCIKKPASNNNTDTQTGMENNNTGMTSEFTAICVANPAVFSQAAADGQWSGMKNTYVRDLKKKNSENEFRVYEYNGTSITDFLEVYKAATSFPGEGDEEVMRLTDQLGREWILLDIWLEEQLRYTPLEDRILIVQDALWLKGCEGNNCILSQDMLNLITCTPPIVSVN